MGVNAQPLPSCDIVGPDGRRVVVRPHRSSDRVEDLARALGIDGDIDIDGRRGCPGATLEAAGLRVGSAVERSVPHRDQITARDEPAVIEPAVVEVAVVAGPACTGWRPLERGRHVVGRSATAAVRIEDPDVEINHGWLEVNADGGAWFTQLTGKVPARIDDRVCDVRDVFAPGAHLYLGASVVAIRPARLDADRCSTQLGRASHGSVVASTSDPWHEVVLRAPRSPQREPVPELVVPEPPAAHRSPPAIGLVGAAIAAVGAGVMALVLGQALFAMFAMIGAVGSLATWAVGSLGARRANRRSMIGYRARLDTFAVAVEALHRCVDERHRADHRDVADALSVVDHQRGRIWERRASAAEPPRVTLGRGDVHWLVPIDPTARRTLPADLLVDIASCERLVEVTVPFELCPDTVTALGGDRRLGAAIARSMILQLAALYGPADLRLVVITDRADDWSWVAWLPHADAPIDVAHPAHAEVLRALAEESCPASATVVIADVPSAFTARTGAVRRMLVATGAACVVVVPDDQAVPAVCDRVLEFAPTGSAHWVGADLGFAADGAASDIRLSGVGDAVASATARRLAPLIDPEADLLAAGLPAAVQLHGLGVFDPDPASILERWRSQGADPSLVATIGLTADGTIDVDLVRDGPHALIAGTTGAGKSELLRSLIVALASRVGPMHLNFVLVDYKGGSTFDACARLPHTVGVATDLDGGLAERALCSLEAEITRREVLLRDAGADDLTTYRRVSAGSLPRLVVVIDEFAGLAKELPEFLTSLVSIAQRGRSLGLHLILATQRPAGVVTDDIRANTNLRLALRLPDRSDANDVVADDAPVAFPRSMPGRAALRLGAEELVIFQAASCTGPAARSETHLRVDAYRHPGSAPDRHGEVGKEPTELDVLTDSIGAAARLGGLEIGHRPWLEPLPTILQNEEVPDDAVGLVDDPAQQRRLPLRWSVGAGNLALIGALGSGTTTAACALAATILRGDGPERLHLYVLDGRGDRAWDRFAEQAHCGAVIRCNETERLVRLVRRLTADIATRTDSGVVEPQVVVVVDGLGPVRAALGEHDNGQMLVHLDRVLADGPAVGIVACTITDGASARALAVPASQHWVFHVADPMIAKSVGLSAPSSARGVPGRLRIAETGLEAQIAIPRPGPEPMSRPPGAPAPVEVLPAVVDPERLRRHRGPSAPTGATESVLPVGLGAADLAVAELRVPAGDHVLVGGAAGTGKSTALRQLTEAWVDRHADGTVVDVGAGGRVDPAELAGVRREAVDRPLLVVVDDADRIDDTAGVLAAMVAGHDPNVMVLAAARLEAVRVAYGHWTRDIARSRCGLIMTSPGDLDGDLFGTTLPRRAMVPPRPGLAWLIDRRGSQLVQVAARMRP